MGDVGAGTSGLGKSVRSFLETIDSLEKEFELVFDRAKSGSASTLAGYARKFVTGLAGLEAGPKATMDLLKVLRSLSANVEVPLLVKGLARAFGLADEGMVEAVRADVRDIMEQVAKLREREIALAGGVSQLRSRATRFDEALAGLARVQGKYVARLDAQSERSDALERLARRRDDHITRLIRDTVAQRGELERVSNELTVAAKEPRQADAEQARDGIRDVGAKLGTLETQIADFRKLHQSGTQGVLDTLEGVRDRVGKLESRISELSREARAKGGRLDALATHVAGVENRLTSALGKGGETVVAVAAEIDQSLHATG